VEGARPHDESSRPSELIFIVGLARRCGTNFLHNLLSLHPECRSCGVIKEDLIFGHLHHIDQFCDTMDKLWRWKGCREYNQEGNHLPHRLGNEIVDFLLAQPSSAMEEGEQQKPCRYLLTKSPVCRNLDLFDRYFPNAHLVVVTRNGYDATDSMRRAFGMTIGAAARQWKEGVDSLLKLEQSRAQVGKTGGMVRVAYESHVEKRDETLVSIFEALGINSSDYDFDAANALPYFGVSGTGKNGQGVAWESIPSNKAISLQSDRRKSRQFDQATFNVIANEQQEVLGYKSNRFPLLEQVSRLQITFGRTRKKLMRIIRRVV